MTNYLEELYYIFGVESHDNLDEELILDEDDLYDEDDEFNKEEIEAFEKISNGITSLLLPKTNHKKVIVDYIYNNDDISLLEKLLEVIDNNIDECIHDWEKGDWFDDNESHRSMEAHYGEVGNNIYHIYTKNKIHVFKKMTPFSDGGPWHYDTIERD
jgi:hypothetical protein